MACYSAVLGDLDDARSRLDTAFDLDPDLRTLAGTDPDLEALRVAG